MFLPARLSKTDMRCIYVWCDSMHGISRSKFCSKKNLNLMLMWLLKFIPNQHQSVNCNNHHLQTYSAYFFVQFSFYFCLWKNNKLISTFCMLLYNKTWHSFILLFILQSSWETVAIEIFPLTRSYTWKLFNNDPHTIKCKIHVPHFITFAMRSFGWHGRELKKYI